MEANELPPPKKPILRPDPHHLSAIPIVTVDSRILEDDPKAQLFPLPPSDSPAPEAGKPSKKARKRPRAKKHRLRKWIKRVALFLASLLVLSELVTISYVWATPSRTAFMLENQGVVVYQFVSLDHISRYMIAATIAHEDEQLGTRTGAFSIAEFKNRALAYLEGKPDTSGSTIPQQLVKNIFLWPGHDAPRKGVEAVLATEFSLTLSAKRVMELYLNYAQFGPHLYGVCAATWYYFNEPPSHMTPYQAAQLMGVLPMPDAVQRAEGGGIFLGKDQKSPVWQYVNGAANVYVPRQIAGLGGWQSAVARIGIFDTASDHAATANQPDGCSTMPQSVLDMILL
ncbi:monofunctional biosynthetic peptidoglycan transglycosylase [Arthrobacter silviterrae]|uniref:Transglycosylase n=1 Tax=Arthrobacter silviterrae TaxID=2026658 RepID=A0ABX0DJH8_9MICC|nr:transglycosylase domain-containing protein [Arthrobacter silviterrae]MDQ0276547.1 monofunctional biosynthetic peptidoglycan transglycosylase [Arthrobacter silviterrae]NGN84830.1 transglycosylase [Arthrobacter silviterrae]